MSGGNSGQDSESGGELHDDDVICVCGLTDGEKARKECIIWNESWRKELYCDQALVND